MIKPRGAMSCVHVAHTALVLGVLTLFCSTGALALAEVVSTGSSGADTEPAASVTLQARPEAQTEASLLVCPIFSDAVIHFTPDEPGRYDSEDIAHEEDGRVVVRTVDLPVWKQPLRIIADVSIRPIPEDELSVHDHWDRAGNVRLSPSGMADIELVKFVTAYGGETEYHVDMSRFAPLLSGACTFRAFIDTWSSPGWILDLSIRFERPDGEPDGMPALPGEPDWCLGVLYHEGLTEEILRDGPIEVAVDVPEGTDRVVLYYLSSGHCTDGTDADEFISKDNVITVDGVVVYRYRPWRDDCREFRAINPYTRRWSDGTWSSDYSRSGWCPGDEVKPLTLDLTDHLTPGRHVVGFNIEDVRPADAQGNFGYWRVSSHLVGWKE